MRIAAIKTAVTADTSGFDMAMRRVRAQAQAMRRPLTPTMGALGGFGGVGAGFGRIGAAGFAGGPAAIGLTAAIVGLTSIMREANEHAKRSARDLGEVAELGLTPEEQMRYRAASRAVFGDEATAGQLVGAQRQMQTMSPQQRALFSGVDISGLQSDDLGTFLDALHRVSSSMGREQRLAAAEALGGDAGKALMRAAVLPLSQGQLGQFGAMHGGGGHIADAFKAEAERIDQLRTGELDTDSIWADIWNWMKRTLSSYDEQRALLSEISRKVEGPPR